MANMRRHAMRVGVLALVALLVSVGVIEPAWSAPDEDYQKGASAYRSGDVIGGMGLLRKAADQGHAAAQALLGEILDRAEFNEEAIAYFRKAAEQGNADGQYGLGVMYLTGEGVGKDPQQALFWFKRAADTNHLDAVRAAAQIYLGALAAAGASTRLDADGLQLVRRAADQGYLPAVDALARAFRNGEFGVAADIKQAEHWEAKAKELRKVAGARKKKR